MPARYGKARYLTTQTSDASSVRFMFDPACPYAWKTSLWVRDVAKRRPIKVDWDLFSLEYANRESGSPEYLARARKNRLALRLLRLAKAQGGNEAIDKLYLALGRARHERKEQLDNPDTIHAALSEAGLPAELYEQAQSRADLDDTLQQEYEAAEETGAFGVPTLYFDEDDTPYFGPVVDPAPQGEEAAMLWDNLSGIARQPYFFELKRPRG